MIKKTITYTDYSGNSRTEDFYFNLSKAELLEMELSTSGGVQQMIQNIINAQDTPSLVKLFKDFITKSYGQKSPDGKRFMKSEEIINDFVQTEAYSNLFMELLTNTQKASDFINGIIPADVSKQIADHPELMQTTSVVPMPTSNT